MAKCLICGKECKGECCSGACRAKKSRRARTDKPAHATAHEGVTLTKADSHIDASDITIVKVLHQAIAKPTFRPYAGELTKARQLSSKGFNK